MGMDNFEKLKGLVEDIKTAMLTTVDTNGEMRSRPMSTTEIQNDGVLWFFTYADSPKTQEIDHDGHVNISYVGKNETYVSVSGKAATIRDRNKIEELWNPILDAWFEKGKDDPNISLIRVEPHMAEFWDSPSGLKKTYEMAKAMVTNGKFDKGQNEKINF